MKYDIGSTKLMVDTANRIYDNMNDKLEILIRDGFQVQYDERMYILYKDEFFRGGPTIEAASHRCHRDYYKIYYDNCKATN